MYQDRVEAGVRLGSALKEYAGRDDVIVCGIPREGVVIAAEAAGEMGTANACLVVCRIGMPCFPEVTLGAIDADGEVAFDPSTELTRHELRRIGNSVQTQISDKVIKCRGDKPEPDYNGTTAIVCDEAVVDEIVPEAAATYLRRHGAKRVVLAAPVILSSLMESLREHFDDVVALESPPVYKGARAMYTQPDRLSDSEIESVMKASS